MYVIIIPWVQGMYGIYCTEAQGYETQRDEEQ